MNEQINSLKSALLACVNDSHVVTDMTGTLKVITQLESASITKELLESTRLGLVVNSIRKSNSSSLDLARRCRALIKRWQTSVVGARAPSACSSGNSTPRTPAHAIRRVQSDVHTLVRTQPHTPALHSSVTPSPKVNAGASSSLTNNSYAPCNNGSQSSSSANQQPAVGASSTNTVSVQQNGGGGGLKLKIKLGGQELVRSVSPALKRPTSSPSLCNGAAVTPPLPKPPKKRRKETKPPSPPPLVVEGKPKLKSTAELVADLTAQYPEHMTIDLENSQFSKPAEPAPQEEPEFYSSFGSEEDEENLEQEEVDEDETDSPVRKIVIRERRGRPRGRPRKVPQAPIQVQQPPTQESSRTEVVQKFLDHLEPAPEPVIAAEPPPELNLNAGPAGPSKDWYAILPSLGSLGATSSGEIVNQTGQALRDRRVEKIGQREVLTLPYLDVGLPDFVEYKLPNRENFIIERKWLLQR